MTRKDYELIARAISNARQYTTGPASMSPSASAAIGYIIGYLGSELKLDNARFDLSKFRAACGCEESGKGRID